MVLASSRRALFAAVACGFLTSCGGSGSSPADPTVPTDSTSASAAVPDSSPTGQSDPTGQADPAGPTHPTGSADRTGPTSPTSPIPVSGTATRDSVIDHYGRIHPTAWGLDVPGVTTAFPATGKVAALTFDACGGPGGGGYDRELIDFLRGWSVPATLFLNSRWIDANPGAFRELTADPLFEIANHGTRHRPLSVSSRSAYGIEGTRNVGEVYDEVTVNRDKIASILGHAPRFFRPGTAHCDDVAVRVAADIGERVVGFTVNGDSGATFTPSQVEHAVAGVRPGSIVIAHMNHPGGGTARGMAAAIPRLLASGFAFVRVSEAMPVLADQ